MTVPQAFSFEIAQVRSGSPIFRAMHIGDTDRSYGLIGDLKGVCTRQITDCMLLH